MQSINLRCRDIYTKDYADLIDTFERVAMPEKIAIFILYFISGGRHIRAVEKCIKNGF